MELCLTDPRLHDLVLVKPTLACPNLPEPLSPEHNLILIEPRSYDGQQIPSDFNDVVYFNYITRFLLDHTVD